MKEKHHCQAGYLLLSFLIILLSVFWVGATGTALAQDGPKTPASRIRIVGQGGEAVLTLYDTALSKEVLAQLPVMLTFRDYAGEEKIANLPRKLNTAGSQSGGEAEGDFAYFAQWGNLALFYKGHAQAGGGLHILGRIESGKDWLSGQERDFKALVEPVE